MAIFAPNHKLENFKDDLYVYGFWDYLPANGENVGGEGAFVPSGMTFINEPMVNNELVGMPNSVILRWTKNQYDNYIKNIFYKDFARILWNNAKQSEEPSKIIEDKNIYTYTFNSMILPPVLTEDYDLAENQVEAKNILLDDLSDMISTNNISIPNKILVLSFILQPVFVTAEDVVFNPDNLLLTMCRYLSDNNLFDCKSALNFEIDYLQFNIADNNSLTLDNLTSKLLIKYHQNYRFPGQRGVPKPNCKLCSPYIVYCSSIFSLAGIDFGSGGIVSKYILSYKGLYLAKTVDLEPPIPEDAKMFRTFEDAQQYYFETLNNTPSKWACIETSISMVSGNVPRECHEILESCVFIYEQDEDVIIYDTQQECEENCNKKWYCLEYQCTKVDKDSQLVEGLEGYDTQAECEENCEIPSSSSSSSSDP
jgi:hypothetical protein